MTRLLGRAAPVCARGHSEQRLEVFREVRVVGIPQLGRKCRNAEVRLFAQARCPLLQAATSNHRVQREPEVALGEGEDASSEIYSLGMVLFYAITGRTFYDADELESLARRHTATLRVSASAKMQDLRTSVAILIEAMIRKERQNRPQDFIYVADSIKAILQEIG